MAGDRAAGWLAAAGLPARLTGHDGRVRRLGGWPAGDGRPVPVTRGSHVYCRRAAMNAVLGGSQALWFVSRASGLALLAAFSAVVVLGVAARLGPRLARPSASCTGRWRCSAVAFLGCTWLAAILDPYVTIGWAATLLPLASPYRTLAIGLGALAVDLGGAVLITSLARRRLGYRAWRAVHWLAYLTCAGRVRARGHAPEVTCGSGGSRWSCGGAPRRSRRR